MKLYKCLTGAVVLLLISCQSTGESKEKTADNTVTTLSPDEKKVKRENDIKAAVNNKELLVGKWILIGADSAGIKIKKDQLVQIQFSQIEFSKDLKFTGIFNNGASLPGIYELIAENREIVVTSDQESGHMLIKSINDIELKTKEAGINYYFTRDK